MMLGVAPPRSPSRWVAGVSAPATYVFGDLSTMRFEIRDVTC